jgi:hypothetical protein
MNPSLVENNIRHIINYRLNQCRNLKLRYYNFLYNFGCFVFLVGTIGSVLYFKFKSHTVEEQKVRENIKRDYILYNLRKYQNIKNSHITNIPQF